MDYAIYKTTDNGAPRIIHRFTQEACAHRAKRVARAKLDDMRHRTLQRPALFKNFSGTPDDFEYDYMTSVHTSVSIRFYIAPLK